MFLSSPPQKKAIPLHLEKLKKLDVHFLWKQLGRLTYLGLGLEILKVVQVEQFSMTLQKRKTQENITKQWNEIEVQRKIRWWTCIQKGKTPRLLKKIANAFNQQ